MPAQTNNQRNKKSDGAAGAASGNMAATPVVARPMKASATAQLTRDLLSEYLLNEIRKGRGKGQVEVFTLEMRQSRLSQYHHRGRNRESRSLKGRRYGLPR